MALTYTPKIIENKKFPQFKLQTVDGQVFSSQEIKNDQVICVMFICNHCPYVKAVEDRLIELGNSLTHKNVQMIAICSNDPKDHPEDSIENLAKRAKEKNYPFPYLFDESQEVAKLFGAVCTPDIFVFDRNQNLYYRGRIDDSWRDPSKVTNQELKAAIHSALENKIAPKDQIPSMGCSIKWK